MVFWLHPNPFYKKGLPDKVELESSWWIEFIKPNDWLDSNMLDHNCGGYIYVGF